MTKLATSSSAGFHPTQWTRVLEAQGNSEPARQALSDLCAAYYEPIVAFLTRSGRNPADARDIAHAFFARLLEGDFLTHVRREGRFRSYLLGALKHFVSHLQAREQRIKRGGGVEMIPLDAGTDTTPAIELPAAGVQAPDAAFDKAWAMTVLDRALAALRAELVAEGKVEEFERLKPWLTGEVEHGAQAELARALGMDSNTLKSTVHRMKRRFRQCVKQEVASTLDNTADVDEEMRALFAALGG